MSDFGMIGLGVMGRNLVLNIADNGFSVLGYDRDTEKQELLISEGAGKPVAAAADITEFIEKLNKPRNIILLVPAGAIVDSVIQQLLPQLEPGDLIIDGGNSHFNDTDRREKVCRERDINFLGVGVSGGEEGARHGASFMIGGDPTVYERVRPAFERIAAKVDGEPCAAHVGRGSAGHFVKMTHNGIEYGLMQLLAETYDIMHRGLGMDYDEMGKIFAEWNEGELNSFLVEITADVLKKKDDKTGQALVEVILDQAGQKGTGKWTSQAAMDFGIPVPTIDAAVTMRELSAIKKERVVAAERFVTPEFENEELKASSAEVLDELRGALHAAFIITFAQGLSLIRAASIEKGYDIDLAEVAKIWRGGCIIRSAHLEHIRQAYTNNKDLQNLLLDDEIGQIVGETYDDLNLIVMEAVNLPIPTLGYMSALAYFDAYRSERLPANLIQGQRDFFGAHTYQRIDEDGVFHTEWVEKPAVSTSKAPIPG